MTLIASVRGQLDTAELGETLMREHVFVLTPEIQQNFPGDEEERVADAVAKLRALREVGVRTIVDLTVIGLGRYIPRIQRVNEQVDNQHRGGDGRLHLRLGAVLFEGEK